MQQVNLGVIGGGTVGGGVYQALERLGALLAARAGVRVTSASIAVKAFDEPRKGRDPTLVIYVLFGVRSRTTRRLTSLPSWWEATRRGR